MHAARAMRRIAARQTARQHHAHPHAHSHPHPSALAIHATPVISSSLNAAVGPVAHTSSSSLLTSSVRPFTSATASSFSASASSAAAGEEDSEGRASAPAAGAGEGEEKQQGQGENDTAEADKSIEATAEPQGKRRVIYDVDPYPPEKLAELEDRYKWVDFNAMAHHLHMTDVHFFDQEVPYLDQDFTIKPDFRLLHRLDSANRLKKLQQLEDAKILRLLNFGFWVTGGSTTRVATEGKIRSVWTMVCGGDQNGTASYGIGKGKDMDIAKRRAMQDLRRNLLFVPMFESRTISHEIIGRYGVCEVRMWPRPRGRGMTAGYIPRMLFECFGLKDITAKVNGRALRHHQVLAIFDGLRQVKSLREEAIRRGVTAHRMTERGIHQPRHPGREELMRRGAEVDSMLREVRAMQQHEDMLIRSGMKAKPRDPRDRGWYYPEVNQLGFEEEEQDPGEREYTPDMVFVPSRVEVMPRPQRSAYHGPAPPLPTNKRAPFKEVLNKTRGLPHPKTPQTKVHTKMQK